MAKWIKLSTELFQDSKIRQIKKMPEGKSMLIVWVQLLTLAGRTEDGGLIYLTKNLPYTPEMLAIEFDEDLNIIKMALSIFSKLEMLDIEDGNPVLITNWSRHQSMDKLEKLKAQNRERQARFKAKKRAQLLPSGETVKNVTKKLPVTQNDKTQNLDNQGDNTLVTLPVTQRSRKVTQTDIDLDKDYKKNKGIFKDNFYQNQYLQNGPKKQIDELGGLEEVKKGFEAHCRSQGFEYLNENGLENYFLGYLLLSVSRKNKKNREPSIVIDLTENKKSLFENCKGYALNFFQRNNLSKKEAAKLAERINEGFTPYQLYQLLQNGKRTFTDAQKNLNFILGKYYLDHGKRLPKVSPNTNSEFVKWQTANA